MPTKEQVAKQYVLDNIPEWYGERCGWKLGPPGRAWVDMTPDSAYMRCIEFFRSSWNVAKETDRYIFMWLAPRRSGKSTIMQTEALRLIAQNRSTEVTYISETEGRAKRASMWMRARLSSPKIKSMFGNFRSKAWSVEEWWVTRPSGLGDNPTVCALGADSAATGYGWDLLCCDDAVGKKTCETPAKREKVITAFEEFHRQRAAGSQSLIWLIGTMWGGWQLYRYILENLSQYAHVVIVPAIGCAEDQYRKPLWSQPETYNYPWIDEERLEQERAAQDEQDYLAQMFNLITQGKHMNFSLKMLNDGTPPLNKGESFCTPTSIDRNQCAIYALIDVASSVTGGHHTSQTAMGICARTCDGKTYMLEAFVGTWALDQSAVKFLELWLKWRPRWYPLETQGPAIGFRTTLEAICQREQIVIPTVRPVSRWGYSKGSRIQQLYPPMNADPCMFVFCRDTIQPVMYDRDPRTGIVSGDARNTFMRYSPTMIRTSFDLLDMFADSVITDREQAPLCPTPPKPERVTLPKYESEATQDLKRILAGGKKYGALPPLR